MTLDLTDEQAAALTAYLRNKLDREKYWLSPTLRPIREILAMLDPPKPKPDPSAALRHIGPPIHFVRPKRR
jgi:hypothetical protein